VCPNEPSPPSIPDLEDFDLSGLPPELATRLEGFRKRFQSACTRIAVAHREIADARNEIETVLKEHGELVSGMTSQATEVKERMEALKRYLEIEPKLSRLKYTGVRLINSKDYSEADETRTRAGAYEQVKALAKTYFPDVPDEILEKLLLDAVKQHLDAAMEERFGSKTPSRG
jgi:hypothetical protein